MVINVTFTEKERWLYEMIMSHSSKSGFIKDLMKEVLGDGPQQQQMKSKEASFQMMDFDNMG